MKFFKVGTNKKPWNVDVQLQTRYKAHILQLNISYQKNMNVEISYISRDGLYVLFSLLIYFILLRF